MGNGPLALPLRDRLTHAATAELHDIQQVLADFALSTTHDECFLVNCYQPDFTSASAYAALHNSDYVDLDAKTI